MLKRGFADLTRFGGRDMRAQGGTFRGNKRYLKAISLPPQCRQPGWGKSVRVSVLVFASMLAATSACAQPDQVRRGPAPAWATSSTPLPVPENVSGSLFVRRQDVETHLSDQGQAQYLGYRVKILQSNALPLGNISIAWNPRSGAPIVHDIKVFRDGKIIDVLGSTSFEILRREDQLE